MTAEHGVNTVPVTSLPLEARHGVRRFVGSSLAGRHAESGANAILAVPSYSVSAYKDNLKGL